MLTFIIYDVNNLFLNFFFFFFYLFIFFESLLYNKYENIYLMYWNMYDRLYSFYIHKYH